MVLRHSLTRLKALTDPPPLRGPVCWSGFLALGVSCIMVWMQDQNEAHSREDFDSKPKKKKFLHRWNFEKKILRFFFGKFFRIFFWKKDSCDHVFWDKKLIFGYVVPELYTLRSVSLNFENQLRQKKIFSLCLWDVSFILGQLGVNFLCFGPISEKYGKRQAF